MTKVFQNSPIVYAGQAEETVLKICKRAGYHNLPVMSLSWILARDATLAELPNGDMLVR